MFTSVKCEGITDAGVNIVTRGGRKLMLKGDTVVIATGSSSNNPLFKVLKERFIPTISIGDCVNPRRIINAIEEGEKAGREV